LKHTNNHEERYSHFTIHAALITTQNIMPEL